MPLGTSLSLSIPFLFVGGFVGLLLCIVGYTQARATLYTITNRRVAMRIGAALTVTLNLPFTQIDNAAVAKKRWFWQYRFRNCWSCKVFLLCTVASRESMVFS